MSPFYLLPDATDVLHSTQLEELERLTAVVKADAADRLRAYCILFVLGVSALGIATMEVVQRLSVGRGLAFLRAGKELGATRA